MRTAVIATSIIALVCAGFLAGYFLSLQSSTSSDLPEYLAITDVDYGYGSDGWIAVTINNTGLSIVNIAKLLVNDIKQSVVNPVLPVDLAPDNGVVINTTMEITATTYRIDVLTSKGNKFSETTAPNAIAFAGTSSLTITNIQFGTGDQQATISVKNTGTKSVTISLIKVNNVAATISSTSVLTYAAEDSGTISIDLAWTAGNPYKFDIYDTSGQVVGSYQATPPS